MASLLKETYRWPSVYERALSVTSYQAIKSDNCHELPYRTCNGVYYQKGKKEPADEEVDKREPLLTVDWNI